MVEGERSFETRERNVIKLLVTAGYKMIQQWLLCGTVIRRSDFRMSFKDSSYEILDHTF